MLACVLSELSPIESSRARCNDSHSLPTQHLLLVQGCATTELTKRICSSVTVFSRCAGVWHVSRVEMTTCVLHSKASEPVTMANIAVRQRVFIAAAQFACLRFSECWLDYDPKISVRCVVSLRGKLHHHSGGRMTVTPVAVKSSAVQAVQARRSVAQLRGLLSPAPPLLYTRILFDWDGRAHLDPPINHFASHYR